MSDFSGSVNVSQSHKRRGVGNSPAHKSSKNVSESRHNNRSDDEFSLGKQHQQPGVHRQASLTAGPHDYHEQEDMKSKYEGSAHGLGKACFKLYTSQGMQVQMFAMTLANCIWMTVDHPFTNRADRDASEKAAWYGIYVTFAQVFTAELVIYAIGYGLFTPKYGLFRKYMRLYDILFVLTCWLDVIVDLNQYTYVPIIRGIRWVRLFYYLRYISALRMVGRSLQTTIFQMVPILLLLVFLTIIWGSNAVYYFGEWYHYKCLPDEEGQAILQDNEHYLHNQMQQTYAVEQIRRCATRKGVFGQQHMCPTYFTCQKDNESIQPLENFDNFLLASYVIYRMINLETWVDPIYNMHDISGWPAAQSQNILVFISNYVLLPFLMAVVIGEFQQTVSMLYRQRVKREAYGLIEFHELQQSMKKQDGFIRDRKDILGNVHPQCVSGFDLVSFVCQSGHAESKTGAKDQLSKMLRCNVIVPASLSHTGVNAPNTTGTDADKWIDVSEMHFDAAKTALYVLREEDIRSSLIGNWRRSLGLSAFVNFQDCQPILSIDVSCDGIFQADVQPVGFMPDNSLVLSDGVVIDKYSVASMSLVIKDNILYFVPTLNRLPTSNDVLMRDDSSDQNMRSASADPVSTQLPKLSSIVRSSYHNHKNVEISRNQPSTANNTLNSLSNNSSNASKPELESKKSLQPRALFHLQEDTPPTIPTGAANTNNTNNNTNVAQAQSTGPMLQRVASLTRTPSERSASTFKRVGSEVPGALASTPKKGSHLSLIDLNTVPYFSREEVEMSMHESVDIERKGSMESHTAQQMEHLVQPSNNNLRLPSSPLRSKHNSLSPMVRQPSSLCTITEPEDGDGDNNCVKSSVHRTLLNGSEASMNIPQEERNAEDIIKKNTNVKDSLGLVSIASIASNVDSYDNENSSRATSRNASHSPNLLNTNLGEEEPPRNSSMTIEFPVSPSVNITQLTPSNAPPDTSIGNVSTPGTKDIDFYDAPASPALLTKSTSNRRASYIDVYSPDATQQQKLRVLDETSTSYVTKLEELSPLAEDGSKHQTTVVFTDTHSLHGERSDKYDSDVTPITPCSPNDHNTEYTGEVRSDSVVTEMCLKQRFERNTQSTKSLYNMYNQIDECDTSIMMMSPPRRTGDADHTEQSLTSLNTLSNVPIKMMFGSPERSMQDTSTHSLALSTDLPMPTITPSSGKDEDRSPSLQAMRLHPVQSTTLPLEPMPPLLEDGNALYDDASSFLLTHRTQNSYYISELGGSSLVESSKVDTSEEAIIEEEPSPLASPPPVMSNPGSPTNTHRTNNNGKSTLISPKAKANHKAKKDAVLTAMAMKPEFMRMQSQVRLDMSPTFASPKNSGGSGNRAFFNAPQNLPYGFSPSPPAPNHIASPINGASSPLFRQDQAQFSTHSFGPIQRSSSQLQLHAAGSNKAPFHRSDTQPNIDTAVVNVESPTQQASVLVPIITSTIPVAATDKGEGGAFFSNRLDLQIDVMSQASEYSMMDGRTSAVCNTEDVTSTEPTTRVLDTTRNHANNGVSTTQNDSNRNLPPHLASYDTQSVGETTYPPEPSPAPEQSVPESSFNESIDTLEDDWVSKKVQSRAWVLCFNILSRYHYEYSIAFFFVLYLVCVSCFAHDQSELMTLSLTSIMTVCLVFFLIDYSLRLYTLPNVSKTMKASTFIAIHKIDMKDIIEKDEKMQENEASEMPATDDVDEFDNILMVNVGDRKAGHAQANLNPQILASDEAHIGLIMLPYFRSYWFWIDTLFLACAVAETVISVSRGEWPVDPLANDVMIPHGDYTASSLLCYARFLIFFRVIVTLRLVGPLRPLMDVIIKAAPNVLTIVFLIQQVLIFFAVQGMLFLGDIRVPEGQTCTYNSFGFAYLTSIFHIFPDDWAIWSSDYASVATRNLVIITVPLYFVCVILLTPFILVMVLEDLSNAFKEIPSDFILVNKDVYRPPKTSLPTNTASFLSLNAHFSSNSTNPLPSAPPPPLDLEDRSESTSSRISELHPESCNNSSLLPVVASSVASSLLRDSRDQQVSLCIRIDAASAESSSQNMENIPNQQKGRKTLPTLLGSPNEEEVPSPLPVRPMPTLKESKAPVRNSDGKLVEAPSYLHEYRESLQLPKNSLGYGVLPTLPNATIERDSRMSSSKYGSTLNIPSVNSPAIEEGTEEDYQTVKVGSKDEAIITQAKHRRASIVSLGSVGSADSAMVRNIEAAPPIPRFHSIDRRSTTPSQISGTTATSQPTTGARRKYERKMPMRDLMPTADMPGLETSHLVSTQYGEADIRDGVNLFCCFGGKLQNQRKNALKLFTSRIFSWTVTLFIIGDFISMAVEGPSKRAPAFKTLFQNHSKDDPWIEGGYEYAGIEFAANIQFLFKILILYIGLGPKRFLKSNWAIFELVTSIGTTINLIPFGGDVNKVLAIFRSVRILQILVIHNSTNVILRTLFRSLPSVLPLFAIMMFFLFLFAIVGTYQWAGQQWKCNDESVADRTECIGKYFDSSFSVPSHVFGGEDDSEGIPRDREWSTFPWSFDNTGIGFWVVLKVITFDGWYSIAKQVYRLNGMDKQPFSEDGNQNNWLTMYMAYFAIMYIIGNVFFVQLTIAAVYVNYERVTAESDGTANLTEPQQQWNNARNIIRGIQPLLKFKIPPYQPWMPHWLFNVRVRLHLLVDTQFHRLVVNSALCISALYCMSLTSYESDTMRDLRQYMAMIAMCIYIVESIAKCIGLSPSQFWRAVWHRVETFFSVGFFALLVATGILGYQTMEPYYILLHSLVIIRVVQYSVQLSRFMYQFYVALPSIGAVTTVTMVIIASEAMVFMRLFGFIAFRDPSLIFEYTVYERTNLSSFFDSFLVMIRILTTERWPEIMYGIARGPDCSDASYTDSSHYKFLYDMITIGASDEKACSTNSLTSFLAYAMFPFVFFFMWMLLIPLFSAVVLRSFKELTDICNGDITLETIDDFVAIWALLDSQGDEYITIPDLVVLLRALDKPLSVGIGKDRTEMFFREKEQVKQAELELRKQSRGGDTNSIGMKRSTGIEEEMVTTIASQFSYEDDGEQELERIIEKHYSQFNLEELRAMNPYAYRYNPVKEQEDVEMNQLNVPVNVPTASTTNAAIAMHRRRKANQGKAINKLISNLVNPLFKPTEVLSILSALDLPIQESESSRALNTQVLREVTTNELFNIKTRDVKIGNTYGVVSFRSVIYALIRRIIGVQIDIKIPIQNEYVSNTSDFVSQSNVPFIERPVGLPPSTYLTEKHAYGHINENMSPLLTLRYYSVYEVFITIRLQRAFLRKKALKLVRQRAKLNTSNVSQKLGLNEPFLSELVNVKCRLARADVLCRATFPTNSDTLGMRLVNLIERMTLCRKKLITKLSKSAELAMSSKGRTRSRFASPAISRAPSPARRNHTTREEEDEQCSDPILKATPQDNGKPTTEEKTATPRILLPNEIASEAEIPTVIEMHDMYKAQHSLVNPNSQKEDTVTNSTTKFRDEEFIIQAIDAPSLKPHASVILPVMNEEDDSILRGSFQYGSDVASCVTVGNYTRKNGAGGASNANLSPFAQKSYDIISSPTSTAAEESSAAQDSVAIDIQSEASHNQYEQLHMQYVGSNSHMSSNSVEDPSSSQDVSINNEKPLVLRRLSALSMLTPGELARLGLEESETVQAKRDLGYETDSDVEDRVQLPAKGKYVATLQVAHEDEEDEVHHIKYNSPKSLPTGRRNSDVQEASPKATSQRNKYVNF